jgi:GMP synthase (glutamine-hydrolysing)
LKPVLCVSHEASVSPGIAAEVFDEAGVPFRMMRAWEETDWPSPDDIAGLVVLGGEMNAQDVGGFPFLEDVRAFTSAVVAGGAPVFGICLGAQILAMVLGGSVTPSPRVEIGFKLLDATTEGRNDPVLGGFADDIAVFQWHEDTFMLPPAVTLLFSGGGFDQAFRWGADCYGTQFHFEVTESDIAAWIEATPPERLLQHWGRSGEEVLAEARSKLPPQQEAARVAFRRWAALLEL